MAAVEDDDLGAWARRVRSRRDVADNSLHLSDGLSKSNARDLSADRRRDSQDHGHADKVFHARPPLSFNESVPRYHSRSTGD